ncbi:MAG: hypothetical protein SPI83_05145 [Rothia sp. (in: high G+C Gram-positive bacteria)]|nr:hypothetical protein [Rothia sp. (in: high G+C Gram-positive bacteria)]
MNSEKPLENGAEKKAKKPVTRGELIRAWIFLLVVILPAFYGMATVFFSTPFNRVFNYEKECTIAWGAVGSSGSKSYSGSSYVYVESPDCGGMRYVGKRHGLTHKEVADRVDLLEGQRVTL